jgi:hypothetical protein
MARCGEGVTAGPRADPGGTYSHVHHHIAACATCGRQPAGDARCTANLFEVVLHAVGTYHRSAHLTGGRFCFPLGSPRPGHRQRGCRPLQGRMQRTDVRLTFDGTRNMHPFHAPGGMPIE